MSVKLAVIIGVSLATVVLMFVLGKLADGKDGEGENAENKG